jgi:hypothetical protein
MMSDTKIAKYNVLGIRHDNAPYRAKDYSFSSVLFYPHKTHYHPLHHCKQYADITSLGQSCFALQYLSKNQ